MVRGVLPVLMRSLVPRFRVRGTISTEGSTPGFRSGAGRGRRDPRD
jgi:hypothetical protein